MCSLNDAVADDVLRDRSAVNFLTRRGGLELNSDMTQAEKRRAVKEAVERITAAQEETVLPEGEASTIIEVDETPFTIGTSLGAKAKNYDVLDTTTGVLYRFVEGTRIESPTVFAGYKGAKPLYEDTVAGLVKEFGGEADKWQHVKGIGTLDVDGEEIMAEIHWFQEESVGKVKFKVKEWFYN